MTQVQVLVADLATAPELAARAGTLSASSQARLARIRSPARRRQGLLARQLAALAASRLLGRCCLAQAIEESPGERGVVFGDGVMFGDGARVAVSISHRRARVAVAVGAGPLGIDIECCDRRDWLAAARLVYSAAEVEWLEQGDGDERRERFYLLWTLREAAFKAGLRPAALGGGPCLDPDSGERRFHWDSRRLHGYCVSVATPAPAEIDWARLTDTGLAPLDDEGLPGARGADGTNHRYLYRLS